MTDVNIQIEDAANSTPEAPVKIIHIAGQLDESNVDEKIKKIYKLMETNPKNLHLVFDFEKLEYMNSKSIGYLTDLYGKLSEAGGKVSIAGARPNIVDILQVVGLTQLIQSYASVEEAIGSASQTTPTPTPEAPAQPETETQPKTPAPAVETPAQPVEQSTSDTPAAPEVEAPQAPVMDTPQTTEAAPQATPTPEAPAQPEAPQGPEQPSGETYNIEQ